jgi:HAE1 family hydrophobic/amphiphilic exporter-1
MGPPAPPPAGGGLGGLTRLPTAFIPIDDQGYLMLAIQLPEGASLGRTTASLEEAGRRAREIPGVQEIIALSGMSVLDNSADLANAGTVWVMLKPFGERLKAGGQDLLTLYQSLQ